MHDAALDPTTDDGPDADALIADLADAHEALQRARQRVDDVGEERLQELADADEDVTALFDRYEEAVTGDGDFQTFIEFQGKVATITEELPADLRHRDVFEDVDDLLQQRRLTESDWARVRETLEPVRDDVARLDERADVREAYRKARLAVERRRDAVADRIQALERLQRLGEADLDAPTERLRDPLDRYNERVTAAFETFTSDASARKVLHFLQRTAAFPLVPFQSPPDDLVAFVETHEAGSEPLSQLLEYADYSKSKLDHYVDDPDALKLSVATNQTYLRRLDASPLTVDWPPPDADTLWYRCRELESVVARFVDDGDQGDGGDGDVGGEAVLVALRTVRNLPTETDYQRLRESAQARDQLGDDERERLASGAVEAELAERRAETDRLADALADHPSL